ncbi:MAG: hypothetical protein ABI406_19985 [Ktedonobacteraceae bacterium]
MAPTQWLVFLLLLFLSLIGVAAQVVYTIFSHRRQRIVHEQYVSAAVTKVEEENDGYSSIWYVTAIWTDEAKRLYTFRSSPLTRRPKVHPGETIFVRFDPNHSTRYDMLL